MFSFSSSPAVIFQTQSHLFSLKIQPLPHYYTELNTLKHLIFVFQFRLCMKKMLGMSADEDEESSTSQSTTEVSKVGPS